MHSDMSMFVPMDSPVGLQQQLFGHLFKCFFWLLWHFPHSHSLIALSSLSLPSHSRCLLHMLFQIIFFFVPSLSSLALCMSMQFCAHFILALFRLLPMVITIGSCFMKWVFAIALHSLCFGFYLWLQQSQLNFCLHCFDFYLWLQQLAWLVFTVAPINSCFVSFCWFQCFGRF
jgi:hypothetical protein